jgi:hypothetical protein
MIAVLACCFRLVSCLWRLSLRTSILLDPSLARTLPCCTFRVTPMLHHFGQCQDQMMNRCRLPGESKRQHLGLQVKKCSRSLNFIDQTRPLICIEAWVLDPCFEKCGPPLANSNVSGREVECVMHFAWHRTHVNSTYHICLLLPCSFECNILARIC